jgi:hypothetical protein
MAPAAGTSLDLSDATAAQQFILTPHEATAALRANDRRMSGGAASWGPTLWAWNGVSL